MGIGQSGGVDLSGANWGVVLAVAAIPFLLVGLGWALAKLL